MKPTLVRCTEDDLAALREIGIQTYSTTFVGMCSEDVMAAYLAEAFSEKKLLAELRNHHSAFFFLQADGQLAGYMKVNELDAQGDLKGPDTFELERIYVRNTHKGHGLGRFMVEQAIKMAIQRGKKQLWVGVWEKNLDAIEFYKRHGFTKISEHDFYMGTERQRDHVMALNLEPCIDPSG